MPVPRAAVAEVGRIPPGLRPEPSSFSFQGEPSSYEEPPGALGTGPDGAAVWGDRRRGGRVFKVGDPQPGSAPSWPLRAPLPIGLARPPCLPERSAAGRVEAPPSLPVPGTPTVGGATGAVLGPAAASGLLRLCSRKKIFKQNPGVSGREGRFWQAESRRQAGERTVVLLLVWCCGSESHYPLSIGVLIFTLSTLCLSLLKISGVFIKLDQL